MTPLFPSVLVRTATKHFLYPGSDWPALSILLTSFLLIDESHGLFGQIFEYSGNKGPGVKNRVVNGYVHKGLQLDSNQAVYSSFAVCGVRRRLVGTVSKHTLVFLGIADLPRRLHQVFLIDIVPACVRD